MILNKKKIKEIEKAFKRANKAEIGLLLATKSLEESIISATGVYGKVDLLQGDGFGFTPLSNNDTHIGMKFLIENAKKGVDIDEEFIFDNCTI